MIKHSILPGIAAAGILLASSQEVSASLMIPDGNPFGITDTIAIASSITSISSVSVSLDISSEYNGDLYVYLRHGSAISVLLNRTGRTGSDASGYDDKGFNVVFSDAAAGDIHIYQSLTLPPYSPLTGIWQPDARTADPDKVTEASGRSAFLSSFNGKAASGDWTLFLADLSTGDTSVLNKWSLDIQGTTTPVPEPSTWLAGLGALVMLGLFKGLGQKQIGSAASSTSRD
jgi:subtilisin-like proprotein convertase family protein